MKTDMKHINTLAAAVFLAAALSSCAKMRVETEDVRPAGTPIRMAVSSEGTQTKALFDAASFSAKGNVLQIWDVYFNSVVAPQAYIEGTNVVSTGTGAVWPFKEGDAVSSPDKHYYWTKTGTYRFYGVLVKDNSGSAPLTPTTGWGFDAAHKVYSVPTTTLILTSPQFDFVYSNVIERNLDNGAPTTAVPLKFNHLFSAFGFTLLNDSPSVFKIKSVKLNVDDVARATVDYSNVWDGNYKPADVDDWQPEVKYLDMSMSSTSGIQGISKDLNPSERYDIFSDKQVTDTDAYSDFTLIWPQDLTDRTLEVSYESTENKAVDISMPIYSYNNKGSFYVSFTKNLEEVTAGDLYKSKDYKYDTRSRRYSYAGRGQGEYAIAKYSETYFYGYQQLCYISGYETITLIQPITENKNLSVNLANITPDGRWNAGSRYLYNLVYSDNEIGLTVTVMKWDGGHGGDVTFE